MASRAQEKKILCFQVAQILLESTLCGSCKLNLNPGALVILHMNLHLRLFLMQQRSLWTVANHAHTCKLDKMTLSQIKSLDLSIADDDCRSSRDAEGQATAVGIAAGEGTGPDIVHSQAGRGQLDTAGRTFQDPNLPLGACG